MTKEAFYRYLLCFYCLRSCLPLNDCLNNNKTKNIIQCIWISKKPGGGKIHLTKPFRPQAQNALTRKKSDTQNRRPSSKLKNVADNNPGLGIRWGIAAMSTTATGPQKKSPQNNMISSIVFAECVFAERKEAKGKPLLQGVYYTEDNKEKEEQGNKPIGKLTELRGWVVD